MERGAWNGERRIAILSLRPIRHSLADRVLDGRLDSRRFALLIAAGPQYRVGYTLRSYNEREDDADRRNVKHRKSTRTRTAHASAGKFLRFKRSWGSGAPGNSASQSVF